MKFSDISKDDWEELRPYLDTCLLPVTGMTGGEQPYEATECLERLRDMMDLVEIPFKGRVVTYPACHYTMENRQFSAVVDQWCRSLKAAGFRYVVLITADHSLRITCEHADLLLQPGDDGALPSAEEVSRQIRALWDGQAT